jgi:hypothetical protein
VFADAIDYWMEAIFAAALGLSAAALAAVARAGSSSPAATVGWVVGASGSAVLATVALATAIEGRETLDWLFPLGFLLIVAGYLTLGVLDARGRLDPSRAGLVLVIGFIGAAVVDSVVGGILGTEGEGAPGVASCSPRPGRRSGDCSRKRRPRIPRNHSRHRAPLEHRGIAALATSIWSILRAIARKIDHSAY